MSLADLNPVNFVRKAKQPVHRPKPLTVLEEPSFIESSSSSSEEEIEDQIPTLINSRTRHERHKTVISDVSGYGDGIILPLSSSSGDISMGFLSRLNLQERKAIGEKRPVRVYDILPSDMKSQSFMIQFNLENPSNRFLLVHRAVVQSYGELSDMDKREMMFVALSFVKRFEFIDSFLSIPLGNSSQVGIIYPTFYAHIIVSDVNHYLKLFRKLSSTGVIPSWPESAQRWVTPLWVPGSEENPNFDSFKRSVLNNTSTYPNRDVILLSKRRVISHVPPLKKFVEPDKLCSDFTEIISEQHLAIGVHSQQFIHNGCDELERWQYCDYMYKRTSTFLLKHPHTKCTMRISLGSRIILDSKTKVVGFMKFYSKIPNHFLKKKPSNEADMKEPSHDKIPQIEVPVRSRIQKTSALSPNFPNSTETKHDSLLSQEKHKHGTRSDDNLSIRSSSSVINDVSSTARKYPLPPGLRPKYAASDNVSQRSFSSSASDISGLASMREVKGGQGDENRLKANDNGASAFDGNLAASKTASSQNDSPNSQQVGGITLNKKSFCRIGECVNNVVGHCKETFRMFQPPKRF